MKVWQETIFFYTRKLLIGKLHVNMKQGFYDRLCLASSR